MSKGGAGPYKKGAQFERDTRKHYEVHEWYAIRHPQSRSPLDVFAFRGGIGHMVQCKMAGKIPLAEKEKLLELSGRFSCTPVLARKKEGKVDLVHLETGEAIEL